MMINYYLLTKPGIILGNLITVAAGVMLASKGEFDFYLFIATLLGLGLIIASACVFNNVIDKKIDQKMKRTQNRPIARGLISMSNALAFATILSILGNFVLYHYTNLIALCIADFGFLVYVGIYTPWKTKTIYGTGIGSIAGAVCPVVGYCAAYPHIDAAACILFLIMVIWQMPHFYAIALYRLEDYVSAGIPVLPVKKGVFRTKVQMMCYVVGFMGASFLLTLFGYTGYFYLVVAGVLGITWLLLSISGFKSRNDQVWARKMFVHSLIVITTLFVTASFA